MKSFQLVIDGAYVRRGSITEAKTRWNNSMLEHLALKRKFRNIKLLNVGYQENCDTINVLLSQKDTLNTIEICSGQWIAQSLMDSLAMMENLQSIVLKSSKLSGTTNLNAKSLINLKHVAVTHKEMDFLRFFIKSQIISLEINFLYDLPFEDEKARMKIFDEFLSTQTKLTSLKIDNFNDDCLIKLPIHSKFQLKYFSVALRSSFNRTSVEFNLIEFLQTQVNSLEKLDINFKPSSELLNFIFKKLKQLKKLSLNLRFYHFNESCSIKPSHNIKKLTLIDYHLNEKTAVILMIMFQHLESLKLTKETFKKSKNCFQDLNCLKFPFLKKLYVDVNSIEDWTRFIENNPTVELIFVENLRKHAFLDMKKGA